MNTGADTGLGVSPGWADWPTPQVGQSVGVRRGQFLELCLAVVVVMTVVVVRRRRGKRRSGEDQDEERCCKDLLHGVNVARCLLWKY